MSREQIDTNSQYNDDIPDGIYNFEIVKCLAKDIKDKRGYEWTLKYDSGEGKVLTWPSQIGPLLRVLGCKEIEPGKFDFDTEFMMGLKFRATIVHEKAKKSDKVYCNIKDFQHAKSDNDVPF